MTPFEEELRRALARCEPPQGFTERFLQKVNTRVADPPRSRNLWTRFLAVSFPGRVACVAGLIALLLVAGAFARREQTRREKGEAAKQQLLLAMHIAGAQLREARLRVKRIEFPEVVMQ